MTSASRGTFSRISVSSVSRLAIISGSVAFLAPEIGMVPLSALAADDAYPIHARPARLRAIACRSMNARCYMQQSRYIAPSPPECGESRTRSDLVPALLGAGALRRRSCALRRRRFSRSAAASRAARPAGFLGSCLSSSRLRVMALISASSAAAQDRPCLAPFILRPLPCALGARYGSFRRVRAPVAGPHHFAAVAQW